MAVLGKLRAELKDKPYEDNLKQLARSAVDVIGPANTEDFSSCFCSEIVAEALQRIGILNSRLPANEFTPADLANHPLVSESILFPRSYSHA